MAHRRDEGKLILFLVIRGGLEIALEINYRSPFPMEDSLNVINGHYKPPIVQQKSPTPALIPTKAIIIQ